MEAVASGVAISKDELTTNTFEPGDGVEDFVEKVRKENWVRRRADTVVDLTEMSDVGLIR